MDLLRDAETKVVLELAMTTPGGPCDAPFAPIDPTLHAAAVRLVEEAGLQDQLRYFRNR